VETTGEKLYAGLQSAARGENKKNGAVARVWGRNGETKNDALWPCGHRVLRKMGGAYRWNLRIAERIALSFSSARLAPNQLG
jgi:hypothetical protein